MLWGAFWFIYASLIRWRTSRVAYFAAIGAMQYYIMSHGVNGKAPSPLDAFIMAHYQPMVFPGLAGLLMGIAMGFMNEREVQTLYKVVIFALVGGLSVYFANDVRYALWSSFL